MSDQSEKKETCLPGEVTDQLFGILHEQVTVYDDRIAKTDKRIEEWSRREADPDVRSSILDGLEEQRLFYSKKRADAQRVCDLVEKGCEQKESSQADEDEFKKFGAED
jgi:hypothetical protein